jgi:hypothetical protein
MAGICRAVTWLELQIFVRINGLVAIAAGAFHQMKEHPAVASLMLSACVTRLGRASSESLGLRMWIVK